MNIGIIGLGYVGLPLAVGFSQRGWNVIGFDIDKDKIRRLLEGAVGDLIAVEKFQQALANGLKLTAAAEELTAVNFYIITVPTPVDAYFVPDLKYLRAASSLVGQSLAKGDIVVYESTVYPGCTEEDCVPILENISGLKMGVDFGVGYSPERINPGDKERTIEKIVKIISADTAKTLDVVAHVYGSLIDAGLYKAPSIKVAEAAKVIENAQRDVNISFVNELALIFDRMQIDTNAVIDAAATKWNFLPFRPGLVGGHCISVDPYYLAYKSEQLGYLPEVILSGRKVNNSVGPFIAQKIVKLLSKESVPLKEAKVLLLGFAFKENCADCRNSKVLDMYQELVDFGVQVRIYDPWVDVAFVAANWQIAIDAQLYETQYDAIVLAVAHEQFLSINIPALTHTKTIVFDVKGMLPLGWVTHRL